MNRALVLLCAELLRKAHDELAKEDTGLMGCGKLVESTDDAVGDDALAA